MKIKGLLVLMVVVGVGLFMFAGCSKDQPAASSNADSDHGHDHAAHADNDADHDADHDSHEGHDHDGEGHAHADEATSKYANTKCPIMGNVINPEKVTESLLKEYKGQKVAFCCAGCPEKWDALSDEDKATKLLASK